MVVNSWWVLLFGLFCYGGYDLATQRQDAERKRLQTEIVSCQDALVSLDRRLEQMEGERASYDDPAFLEMRLMEGLGLVPKGQVKVIFKE